MKYRIIIERTTKDYWSNLIEADSEKAAIKKGLRMAKKEEEQGYDTFCDGSGSEMRIHQSFPERQT